MPIPSGTHIGPYKILEAIGAGGMGEVYKAHDARLQRNVAIKVLRQSPVHPGTADGTIRERFQREARAASALSHPNICSVFDVGEADGQPYMVMELLEGLTLRERIDDRALETQDAVSIAYQLITALDAAHKKGIVHRDIKPANVMMTSHGHVKVLDFGIAKRTIVDEDQPTQAFDTATGALIGTPQYLSPEVLQGARSDARSDLWAFGVVFYQMLSGRLPFNGATLFEMSSSILKEPTPPLPPRVPPPVRSIVERCLAKRPDDRYASAGDVLAAIEKIRMPAAAPRYRPLLIGVLMTLALAIGLFAWYRQPPPDRVRRLTTGGPPSPVKEANELFEQAMLQQRVQSDVRKAQATLEKALRLDPHFAEAHRYHAFLYGTQLLGGYFNDPSILNKAEEELRQLAQEAPDLPSLPSAQAAVYFIMGRKDLIPLEKLRQAIAQNPQNNNNHNWHMMLNVYAEKNAEARQEALEMLDREPVFANPRVYLGEILRTEGETSRAISEFQKVLENGPNNASAIRRLALAYMDAGDHASARTLLESRRSVLGENYLWRHTLALLLALEGKRDEALKTMDQETLKFASVAVIATLETAEFYAVLGDHSAALDWLEKAVRNGDERINWFRRNPRLTGVRNDPRFRRQIENVQARQKQ